MVDDQDQGTWVKFSYGKFSGQFKWRQPYVGTEQTDVGVTPDADHLPTSSQNFQEGAKETYYLNSIRTRTHSALFIKSARQDGRGHYTSDPTVVSNLGIDERTPASSLRLDEIVVLSNKDLADIQTNTGFSEDTKANSANLPTTLGTGDSFAAVLDQQDISANSAIRTALNQKALKRIVFNYSYRLCPGTPNSFASATAPPALGSTYTAAGRLGKLTLESIATYGPNSVKIIPDFKFDYGFNPAYNPVKRDGFGMYASTGTANLYQPASAFAVASQDGAAWSLTKITNPLGAVTEVKYERDQYSRVSEFYNSSTLLTDQGTAAPSGVLTSGSNLNNLNTYYQAGDIVHIKGYSYENYSITEQPIDQNGQPSDRPNTYDTRCITPYEGDYTIQAISATAITLTSPLPGPNTGSDICVPATTRYYAYTGSDSGYGGCYANIGVPENRNGGDIRVAAVTTRDESGHAYVIKYQYNDALNNTTGVISKEPERIKREDFDFYRLFDYPATPVMYGQTTVLRGNFTTPDDIDQREEYSFYTVFSDMVKPVKTATELTTPSYPFLLQSGPIKLRQQKKRRGHRHGATGPGQKHQAL